MGKRGIPPKPTKLRLLEGEKNKDRINTSEPDPSERPIEPPEDLTEDELRVWYRLSDDLISKGVLTYWDIEMYAGYCRSVVAARTEAAFVRQQGTVITGATGGPVKNPHWTAYKEASEAMLKYAARFGFTPSDRSQLKIGDSDDDAGKNADRLLS